MLLCGGFDDGAGGGRGERRARVSSSERRGVGSAARAPCDVLSPLTHRGRRRVGAQLAQRGPRRALLLLLLLSLLRGELLGERGAGWGRGEKTLGLRRRRTARSNFFSRQIARGAALRLLAAAPNQPTHRHGVLVAAQRGHEARVRLLRRHVHRRVERHGERRHLRRRAETRSCLLFLPVRPVTMRLGNVSGLCEWGSEDVQLCALK